MGAKDKETMRNGGEKKAGGGKGGCAGCAKLADDVVDVVQDAGEAIKDKFEDIGATIADAADDIATTIVPKRVVPQELINAETPEHLWFTPKCGWPQKPEMPEGFVTGTGAKDRKATDWDWDPPHSLCPTGKELPKHFNKPSLGTLRVEILECRELPQLLQLGRADPYAVIIFEGAAARNHTISNDRFPKWDCYSPRAFKFPIRCPYSTLHLAINDDDRGEDDPLGRVVLELGLMRADTTYDCWYALQYSSLVKHVGKRGHVRLRYSIHFDDSSKRLLYYAKPPPTFVVPFRERMDKKDSVFAYRGPHNRNFKWVIFNSHLNELKDDLKSLSELLQSFLFYKLPFLSLFTCALYQFLMSYPKYIPACLPLVAFASITRAYVSKMLENDAHPIREKHTLLDMQMLLLNKGEPPLKADPVDEHQLKEEDLESDGASDSSDSEDEQRADRKGANSKAAAKTAARKKKKDETGGGAMFGLGKLQESLFAKDVSLAEELEEIEKEVEEDIDEMREKITTRRESRLKRMDSMDGAQGKQGFTINPLAKLLFPVQTQLGQVVFYTRTLKRFLSWHDPFLTLQLCLLLILAYIAMSAVGWLLYLVPWGFVFEWTFRLLGFAVFGPHMYFVGLKVEEKQRAKKQEEDEFRDASEPERKAILAKHRQRLMKEAKAALDKQTAEEEEVDSFAESSLALADRYVTLIMRPVPTVGALRFGCQPDPLRSKAYPLDEKYRIALSPEEGFDESSRSRKGPAAADKSGKGLNLDLV